MKKLLILTLLFSFFPICVKAEEINLTPNSTSAILIDASTGKVLYNKNANKKSAVASLTKMMGLVIIFDALDDGIITKDEIITTSKNAKEMGGSQIWLEEGEKISVDDLIKGITMASANDAMVAMAERVSGTEEAFVKEMNKRAKEMGLKNTFFKNSTGLDEDGHYSSASDLSIIARELLKREDILNYTSIYEDYIRQNTANKTWIVNTNKLVRFYEGVDGLKTGYTENAGSCIAATAKKDGMRLIAISLGYKDVNTRNEETKKLLDYGYNLYKASVIFEKGEKVGSVKLEKAEKDQLDFSAENDIVSINKKGEKDKKVTYKINVNNINYPIKKGDIIGTITVSENGDVSNITNLISNDDVNKLNIFNLFTKIYKSMIS